MLPPNCCGDWAKNMYKWIYFLEFSCRTFDGVVKRAYEQTGQKVVVIIDEYDAPLLDVVQTFFRDSQLSVSSHHTNNNGYIK